MMNITPITQENIDYFKPVIPDTLIPRANLMLGAVEEGTPCGVLLAQVNPPEDAELLWFYVEKKRRGQGCGTELFDTFTGLIDKMNIPVSYFTLTETKDTEDMVSFLSDTAYVREMPDAGFVYTFSLRDVDRPLFGRASKNTDIVPLSKADSYVLHGVEKVILQEFSHQVQKDESEAWKRSELSFVCMNGKKVMSCLLVHMDGEEIHMDYLYDSSGNPMNSMGLIARFLEQTDEFCLSPTTALRVPVVNEDMERMLIKMTGGRMKNVGNLSVWTRRL